MSGIAVEAARAPVGVIRNGVRMDIPFAQISAGDVVLGRHGGRACTCGIAAHYCGDAVYGGWLFYDAEGNDWYPEYLGTKQIS